MAAGTSRRKHVALGIVGTGAAWDAGYREAIRQRPQHLAVRGIYDTVPAKAEQTAREFQATVAPSLTNLFERPDIDAVLILDTAWQDWFALELANRFHKPTLISGSWEREVSRLEQIHLTARDTGVFLMAALPRRHLPATNRLRELMVTKLGQPQSIVAEVQWPPDTAFQQLVELIDWCSAILGKQATEITATGAGEQQWTIEIQYPPGIVGAQIHWNQNPSASGTESIRVNCRNGYAMLQEERAVAWSVNGHEVRDNLNSDRSSTEVILDQFCRRVIGGLIPVADLGDVLRSLRLAHSVWPQLQPKS